MPPWKAGNVVPVFLMNSYSFFKLVTRLFAIWHFGEKVENCNKCKQAIPNGDEKEIHKIILCEDCYIDEVMPKMPKAHYENDAEFMQRLKDSYIVRKQQYH